MRIVLRAVRARRVLRLEGRLRAGAGARRRGPIRPAPVCEVDGRVLALAHGDLDLCRAPGLRVHHVEGRACLERQADGSWDAIVIDAFVGAVVPRPLVTSRPWLS